jgi:nucleotide-binding universal stress UspA family protein
MYVSVIAASDGSEQSLLALKHARAIADCFKSQLILVHAFPRTSDLRDSVEYNNLITMRTRVGQAISMRHGSSSDI